MALRLPSSRLRDASHLTWAGQSKESLKRLIKKKISATCDFGTTLLDESAALRMLTVLAS